MIDYLYLIVFISEGVYKDVMEKAPNSDKQGNAGTFLQKGNKFYDKIYYKRTFSLILAMTMMSI